MIPPEQSASGSANVSTPASEAAAGQAEAALGSASVSQVEEDLKKALAEAADHHERYLRAVA